MFEILAKIAGLDKLSRSVLLEGIFEEQKEEHLFRLFKYADSENRDAFLAPLSETQKNWLESQIAKIGEITLEELQRSDQLINESMDALDGQLEKMKVETERNKSQTKINRMMMKECFTMGMGISDQMAGIPIPPPQKDVNPTDGLIDLPDPNTLELSKPNIMACIRDRESHRKFTEEPLTLTELSYLLWATQGVRKVMHQGKISFRTVPSAGSRHPFETYLAVNYVSGLKPGMYRYQPFDHKVVFLFPVENMAEKLTEAAVGQSFVGHSSVVFIWSVIPYRSEWRYTIAAHKVMMIDVGHLCQNLYLACESISCGTCAIGAYSQKLIDELVNVDGEDEFVLYFSPVGKLEKNN